MKELEEGTALSLDFNKLTKAVSACPGVIPVAVQHADTREIILIAYVNELAQAAASAMGIVIDRDACPTEAAQKPALAVVA